MAVKFNRPWLLFAVLCLVCGGYLFCFHSREISFQASDVSSRLELFALQYRAKKGDAEAQIRLGEKFAVTFADTIFCCAKSGEDNEKGLYWYRAAVAQGNAEAQTKLAMLYFDFPETYSTDEARKLLEQAAAQEYPGAFFELGNRAYNRTKAPDYAVAAEWYRKAAEKGHLRAKSKLALLYHEGKGVKKDDTEAARLLIEAAAAGDAWAENRLLEFYMEGWGVAQDWKKAYVSSKFNVRRGFDNHKHFAKIVSKLTSQEINELDEVIAQKEKNHCALLHLLSRSEKFRRFGSSWESCKLDDGRIWRLHGLE